jgi:hypothetical protein
MVGNDRVGLTPFFQDDIHYVAPLYYELVDRHRFWFMMALGMVFRLAVAFAWIDYVMVTFSSIFFGWEFLIAIPQKHMLNKLVFLWAKDI